MTPSIRAADLQLSSPDQFVSGLPRARCAFVKRTLKPSRGELFHGMRVSRCPDSSTDESKAGLESMKNMEQRLSWATTSCRNAQMRLTPVREAILSFLAQRRAPATLDMVSNASGVRGRCDMTTVYRTLMMFKDAELVRLVGTLHKISYFVLNVPGDSMHFLICHQCGRMSELPLPRPLSDEIERIASAQGFAPSPQDGFFHGLCGSCQAVAKTRVVPSKLMVRPPAKVAPSKHAFTTSESDNR